MEVSAHIGERCARGHGPSGRGVSGDRAVHKETGGANCRGVHYVVSGDVDRSATPRSTPKSPLVFDDITRAFGLDFGDVGDVLLVDPDRLLVHLPDLAGRGNGRSGGIGVAVTP